MSMTPAQRTKYFRDFWPAACAARGWSAKDDGRRREATLQCMALVRGPAVTSSDASFGSDEVTALFCYLEHLAHPADLERATRWVDCLKDYRAYNRARQADWHERATYGAGGSKRLRRERFAGAASAAGEALEPFDPAAVKRRHVTMAARHRAKIARERAAAAGREVQGCAAGAGDGAGDVCETGARETEPAYVPPEDAPF